MNNYTYPAIIEKLDDEYFITFPDFELVQTYTRDESSIIVDAQDILALTIGDYLSENRNIPAPSPISSLSIAENQQIVFVNIWLPFHIASTRETYTKKTLTIPTWLDMLAKQKNLNFSHILVQGLKKELRIE